MSENMAHDTLAAHNCSFRCLWYSHFLYSQASEFDVFHEKNHNLTDFSTKVVWTSRVISQQVRNSLRMKSDVVSANFWTRYISRMPSYSAFQVESALPARSNLRQESLKEDAPKIWRPFSSEPSLNVPDERSGDDNCSTNVCETHWCKTFPAITPSYVKLGGTPTSVFRVIKKKKPQNNTLNFSSSAETKFTGCSRAHTGLKPFRCDYPKCSRSFARNEELTRHKKIHSGYKPHQCDVCDKQFGRKDHLNKHRKTHLKTSEKKIYACNVPGCEHRYTRSDALTRHQTTAHSSRVTRFCPRDLT